MVKEDFSTAQIISGIWLKRTFIQGERGLWHLRVAEGDHLSERSEGGKLPQHKTRALATLGKLKILLGGVPGGMQGGRSVDIVNTTGNQEQVAALPRRQRLISVSFRPATASPMAAQTRKAEFGIRKLAGRSPITGPTLPRAAQASQTPVRRRASRPPGRKKSKYKPTPVGRNACRIGRAARRAGVPNAGQA